VHALKTAEIRSNKYEKEYYVQVDGLVTRRIQGLIYGWRPSTS
jgi:hypothetical protein